MRATHKDNGDGTVTTVLHPPCVQEHPQRPVSGFPCCEGCCCTCAAEDWPFECECIR